MTSPVPVHKHCPICENPIRPAEQFCSQKCRDEYENTQRRRRRSSYIWMLVLAAIFILLFFVLPRLSGG